MELKIARSELSKAPNNISLNDIEKEVAKTGQTAFINTAKRMFGENYEYDAVFNETSKKIDLLSLNFFHLRLIRLYRLFFPYFSFFDTDIFLI